MSFERRLAASPLRFRRRAHLAQKGSFLRELSLYSNIAMTVRWQIAIGGNLQQIGRQRGADNLRNALVAAGDASSLKIVFDRGNLDLTEPSIWRKSVKDAFLAQAARRLHFHTGGIVMSDVQNAVKDDDTKIRAAALDYIAGVLEADPARMERCLHPELAKRAYLPGVDGKPQFSHMSALNLILDAKTWKPNPDRHAEVIVLDRYEGVASVRTTFDNWIDYLHIVKVGEDWKIINILWERTPEAWARQSDKSRSSEPAWPRGHG
jgi:Putative lumazine-binding